MSANLALPGLVSILAMTETAIPYEFTWLVILCVPDPLRKLFKLNTEAVGLVLRELDFWIPFVTICLGAFFASASFEHDGAAVLFFTVLVFSYAVNILLGKSAAQRNSDDAHDQVLTIGTLTHDY